MFKTAKMFFLNIVPTTLIILFQMEPISFNYFNNYFTVLNKL